MGCSVANDSAILVILHSIGDKLKDVRGSLVCLFVLGCRSPLKVVDASCLLVGLDSGFLGVSSLLQEDRASSHVLARASRGLLVG